MKFAFTLLFLFIFGPGVYSQVVTYDDFKTIIPLLQKEDFKTAFKKTNELLSTTQNDSSEMRAIVTYMNIFAAAGMVTIGKMTHADFSKNANQYVGQKLIMSAHNCVDSTVLAFNSLKFTTVNGETEGRTVSSNNAMTAIFCFEDYKYAEVINPADFIGKMVRCGGTLDSIEVNPNNSRAWICRMHITNAFARVIEPR